MAIYRGIGGAGDSNTDATVTAVTEQATNAQTSANNAATSATNAASSASAASSSATQAATSATASATSATNSSTSATNAANSATAAANSATEAGVSATNAASSEASVAANATAAATSETNAATSATNAATSETNAATSATNAATSATAAAGSATSASTSASNASSSATAAASSATSAASSASAAQAAQDAALAALDSFDDRYLGTKTSDPTLDNDGNALVAGALYFNTTDEVMKVYEGSQWVAAYASLSGAVLETGGTMSGNLSFGDNDKAIFGAGSDLQIYHDGGNSWIRDAGTGDLYIQGSDQIRIQTNDGAGGYQNALYALDQSETVIYFNGARKLATTSTGIDVTGTATMDGLIVDSDSTLLDFSRVGDAVAGKLKYVDSDTGFHFGTTTNHDWYGITNDTKRFKVDNAGDISFYEDTGTTAKFFWDASAESLGIGTTDIDPWSTSWYALQVGTGSSLVGAVGATSRTFLSDNAYNNGTSQSTTWKYSSTNEASQYTQLDGTHVFRTAASGTADTAITWTDAVTINNSGNVGIGTSSPASALHVSGGVVIENGGSGTNSLDLTYNGASGQANIQADSSGGSTFLTFGTSSSGSVAEAMRLDSSGNLLVGKSTSALGTAGIALTPASKSNFVRNGGPAVNFQRLTSDGDIIEFNKDGTTVGSIGTLTTKLHIGNGIAGLRFVGSSSKIHPHNTTTNTASDGVLDLGSSSERFKDLYLSGTANAARGVGATWSGFSGSSQTFDFATYQNFIVTLNYNFTMGNPTTEAVGQTGFFVFKQDATGGKTISLGSEFKTAGGAGLTLSSAANAIDVVPYIVSASGQILLGTPQLAFA